MLIKERKQQEQNICWLTMGISRICVLFVCLSTISFLRAEDFQESFWNVHYIYHETHNLLLLEADDACYFVHADSSVHSALQDCHHRFLQSQLYDTISWADPHIVMPSTMDAMRTKYGDLLADFICWQKKVFQVRFDGLTFLQNCVGPVVGR